MLISFVIPAYNEECRIGRCISSIQQSCQEYNLSYEIIVSDNLSTDNTANIAKRAGCTVVYQDQESHIGKTRNMGASYAQGDWIVFVDADSVVTKNLMKQCIENMGDAVCISAITRFHRYTNRRSYGVRLFNIVAFFSKTGSGQFLAIDHDVFDTLGGFDPKVYGYEDLDIFRRIRQQYGTSAIHICRTGIFTSDRKFDGSHSVSRFLFDMVYHGFGGQVGRDKQKLSMWYDVEEKQKSTPGRQWVLLFIVLCMFRLRYLEMSTGQILTPQSPRTILVPFGLLSIPLFFMQKRRKSMVIVIGTFFLEFLGHETGLPFGTYHYLEPWSTQVGLWGIPLFIPLAWLIIVSGIVRCSQAWRQAVIGIMIVDFFLEPFATHQGYRVWEHMGILTAPRNNYISRGIVGCLGYFFLKGEQYQTKIWSMACLVVLMVYIVAVTLLA